MVHLPSRRMRMEPVLKRIVSLLSVAVLTFVGLSVVATPASADFSQYNGQTLYYEVGDSVNLDWNLCGGDATDNGFDHGTLPPGLSEDNMGIVTGTVTTEGTYVMSGFWCSVYWASGRASTNSGSITIVVSTPAPVLSPDPSIAAFNLNNANCEVLVVASLPANPDSGSLSLTLNNGTNTVSALLSGYVLGEVIELKVPLDTVGEIANDPTVLSIQTSDSPNGFACGQTVTATVSYTNNGAVAATASSSAVAVTRADELTSTPPGSIHQLIHPKF